MITFTKYTQIMEQLKIQPIKKQTADEIEKQRIENNEKHFFYKVTFRNGTRDRIIFSKTEFLNLLKKYNVYCFEPNLKLKLFIKIEEHTIQEISEKEIQRIVGDYIKNLPDYEESKEIEQKDPQTKEIIKTKVHIKLSGKDIFEYYLNNLDSLFNNRLLNMAHPGHDIHFTMDSKTSKYIFYLNGFVRVTSELSELQPYSKLNSYIWKNQQLSREFHPADDKKGMYERFIERICGLIKPGEQFYEDFDKEKYSKRFESFQTISGYLMHNYMKGKIFASIFTDMRISDDGEANGRTGKTLVGKAFGWMLNTGESSTVYAEISGRKFDVRDKHKYDKCNLDTKLIHLNDCYNNFNIEHLFTDISEGVEAKKLYESPFQIFPKFLITTNKQIKILGESAKARVNIFEFSDYYNANRGPDMETEFNCWFGTDWDPIEWNRFDGFMIRCIQKYLKLGLLVAEPINLKMKMAIEHTSPEFYCWMSERFEVIDQDGNVNENLFKINPPNTEYKNVQFKYDKKSELFLKFKEAYPDFEKKNWFDQRKFTGWVKFLIDCLHPEWKVKENRSHSTDWIWFNEKEIE